MYFIIYILTSISITSILVSIKLMDAIWAKLSNISYEESPITIQCERPQRLLHEQILRPILSHLALFLVSDKGRLGQFVVVIHEAHLIQIGSDFFNFVLFYEFGVRVSGKWSSYKTIRFSLFILRDTYIIFCLLNAEICYHTTILTYE